MTDFLAFEDVDEASYEAYYGGRDFDVLAEHRAVSDEDGDEAPDEATGAAASSLDAEDRHENRRARIESTASNGDEGDANRHDVSTRRVAGRPRRAAPTQTW